MKYEQASLVTFPLCRALAVNVPRKNTTNVLVLTISKQRVIYLSLFTTVDVLALDRRRLFSICMKVFGRIAPVHNRAGKFSHPRV